MTHNFYNQISILSTFKENEIVNIEGICVKPIYISSDDRFGIYLFEDIYECNFMVLSNTTNLVIGQSYFLHGKVVIYNDQLELSLYDFIPYKPNTERGIICFLESIPGIKSKATLIYYTFGDKSIDIVLHHPEKLSQIKGIGSKKINLIAKYSSQFEVNYKTIMVLQSYGLNNNQIIKIIKELGSGVLFKISKNPYQLMNLSNFSFSFCDRLASKQNIGFDSQFRINAAAKQILYEHSYRGHTYMDYDEFMKKLIEILTIKVNGSIINSKTIKIFNKEYIFTNDDVQKLGNNKEIILDTISENDCVINLDKEIIIDNYRVYLKMFYDAEDYISEKIIEMSENKIEKYDESQIIPIVNNICQKDGIKLEKKQMESIIECCKYDSGVFILSGSAGTGKTFISKFIMKVKTILNYLYSNKEELNFIALAPTGKATKILEKNLSELKIPCKTIHRALEYKDKSFLKNERNKLEENFIFIDEFSMVDTLLFSSLLKAINDKSIIIISGDTKQLESIGAGNLLRDVINSGKINLSELSVVKRQTAMSGILKNAEKVINKEEICSEKITDDFYIMNTVSSEHMRKTVLAAIKRLYDKGYRTDDVQLLIPQREGEVGIYYFNYLLQNELNKNKSKISFPKLKFNVKGEELSLSIFINDKVIQTKNDYNKEVFVKENGNLKLDHCGITNGEMGIVSDIYINIDGEKIIEVNYDNFYVLYNDVSDLELAYAITIHKAQGSQWPATIIVVSNNHRFMLSNNLLYTAITRSIDFCGIVSDEEALEYSIKNDRENVRQTSLKEKIIDKSRKK